MKIMIFLKLISLPQNLVRPLQEQRASVCPGKLRKRKETIATVVDTLKSYYDQSVDTASGYAETIKGYKLNEKAK